MDQLLTTKLFIPPPRPDLVPRPHLTDRLEAGSQGKLTLVSAPVGYGKSTLVSEWVARSKTPVAWLSLDESDNDLVRFFSYLIVALQQIDPDIGIEIQSILETGSRPPFENLLTVLVNDIANLATCFILVLDDYHLIQEIKIHQTLDFLFDHFPPGMHMVIISRTMPPMPLGRLRVQRALSEIREVDLRFSTDETSSFLNDLMSLELSPEEIQKLHARTEGWIAGLQLAALTLQDRSDKGEAIATFSGSHRHLIEYLVQEVMSRQTEEMRRFLLYTSLMEKLNAPLCDALMQGTNGRETLDHLERANLFLKPLDDQRNWYRYHSLFAGFLRQRLREEQLEMIPQLFMRASQWFESQGMIQEAIDHALNGGDSIQAARMVDEVAQATIFNAGVRKMIRWVNKLPVDLCTRFPRLCIYHAWALVFEFQLEVAESTLSLAENHLEDPTNLPASFTAAQIIDHATAIHVYLAWARGEYDRAVDLSLEALASLTEDSHPDVRGLQGAIKLCLGMAYLGLGQMEAAWIALKSALPLNQQSGNCYAGLSCLLYLMEVEMARGNLDQAAMHAESGFAWIEEWSGSQDQMERPVRMLAGLRRLLGMLQYERNDLAHAAKNLHKVDDYYRLVQSRGRPIISLALVDLHQALGEEDKALAYLGKIKRIVYGPGFYLPDFPMAASITERNLLLNRSRPELNFLLAEAVEWAEASNLAPGDEFGYEREYEYCTLAQVLAASGREREAIPLLERLIGYAADTGRNGNLIAYLSLQAVAHHALKKNDLALVYLSRALKIGEPQGYLRTFVDLGQPMRELLQLATGRGIAFHYVSKILTAFLEYETITTSTTESELSRRRIYDLVEPLNERETTILHYMASRLSNQEIANELYLSVNTVKWYARNIYSKLGVGNRRQAVVEARELGIL